MGEGDKLKEFLHIKLLGGLNPKNVCARNRYPTEARYSPKRIELIFTEECNARIYGVVS